MARFKRKAAKKKEIVFLLPDSRFPIPPSTSVVHEPESWEPSAPILMLAGLALLMSLVLGLVRSQAGCWEYAILPLCLHRFLFVR
ncbi:MAG TPA: hypothetical protein VD886_03800 [Herpetosiphonaceae bacterium]|nr:hypothetical protein [Herpetosiphonaceae bacterium]